MSSRVNHRMTGYQTCNLIPCRSSVQRLFFSIGRRLVITISFVLQWLCGHTTWLRCSVSLWHISDSWMGEPGKLHQWNTVRGHCYCCCTNQPARRTQVDLTSNNPRYLPKSNFSEPEWLACLLYSLKRCDIFYNILCYFKGQTKVRLVYLCIQIFIQCCTDVLGTKSKMRGCF